MYLTDLLIAAAIAVIGILMGLGVVAIIRAARRKDSWLNLTCTGVFLAAVGGAVLVAVLFMVSIALMGLLVFVWAAILVFVLIESVRKRRISQQNGLLWLLTVSAERLIPLGPAVEAFADERGGRFGRRAKRLAELLSMGAPLPDALELCPKLVPAYALPMIRLGCQSGALAPALRRAAAVQNQYDAVWTSMMGRISYLLVLPLLGMSVLVFIMIWIIPKFSKIFADFHVELPSLTKAIITICYHCANYWYLASPLLLLIAFLLGYAVLRYLGWTVGDPPVISRLVRRLDTARILEGLSIIARQQRPMLEGIASLAASYPKSDMRRLLSLVQGDVESGGDWAEALRWHGLLRQSDFVLLQAAQRAGNLPWAMQEMADSNRRRFVYRCQAMVQATFPPVVIVFGLIVMFIAVAIFMPLVTLIQWQSSCR